MREEYQKTLILVSIILIFGGLYVSTFFDMGMENRSNVILFTILIICSLIGYIQTKKLQRWKEEYQIDYTFVYWSFFWITTLLVFYTTYMFISRSELECMRTLNYNMRGAGRKIWQGTLNLRGGDGMVGMDGTENRGELGRKIFEGYKNIWKRMLFMNR